MRNRTFAMMMAAVLSASVLTSCSLIPEEETFKTAPVIQAYEDKGYVTAVCTREFIEKRTTLTCKYKAVKTDELSFAITGIRYEDIYTHVGDAVTEGELLAKLDMGSLPADLQKAEQSVAELELNITQLEENQELKVRRLELEAQYMDEASAEARRQSLADQYERSLRELNDNLTIARLRVEELEAKIAEREIRAPYTGVVTFVISYSPTDTSLAFKRVVTIADASLSLFVSESDNSVYVQPGTEYEIVSGGNTYLATAVTPAEIGIEPEKKSEKFAYFKLNSPAFDLEEGAKGSIDLQIACSENALTVPAHAVSRINEDMVVYYPDEQGIKRFKKVIVGVSNVHRVEVVEGLEEGEVVIID